MGRYIAEALHEDADLWYHTWISQKSLHQVGGFDGNQDMYDMYLKHYKAMWPLFVGLDPYTLAEFSVSAVPKMWPIEIPRFAGLDLQDHFRNPYGRGGKAPE